VIQAESARLLSFAIVLVFVSTLAAQCVGQNRKSSSPRKVNEAPATERISSSAIWLPGPIFSRVHTRHATGTRATHLPGVSLVRWPKPEHRSKRSSLVVNFTVKTEANSV
jgi:hypothetical protein